MKKLFTFTLIAGLMFAALTAEAGRKVNYLANHGAVCSDIVVEAIDSNTAVVGPKITAAIDTVGTFKFRPIVASLEPAIATATGDDSIYYGCFTVPVGMTAKVRAISLSAAVEYDGGGPSTVELMIINVVDSDTIVEPMSIDEDSVIYNNVALALTVYDTTTLDAGDVVQAYVMGDSTLDIICEGCILTFDLDWDE